MLIQGCSDPLPLILWMCICAIYMTVNVQLNKPCNAVIYKRYKWLL
jgi:hypothetical protein